MSPDEQAAVDAAEDALVQQHIGGLSKNHPPVPSAVDRGEVGGAPDLRPVPSGAASFFGGLLDRATAHITGGREEVPGEFQGVTFGPGSTPMGTPTIPKRDEKIADIKRLKEANPEAFSWGRTTGQLPWDFLMQRFLGYGKGGAGAEALLNAGEKLSGQRDDSWIKALGVDPLLAGIFAKAGEGISTVAGNYFEPLKSAAGRLIPQDVANAVKEFW